MEENLKRKILQERINTFNELQELISNILSFNQTEVKSLNEGNEKYLIYRYRSFEEDEYWGFCLLKIGPVGGSPKLDEKNHTKYILNELKKFHENGVSLDKGKSVYPQKYIIISNDTIYNNFKAEINKEFKNVIFWDLSIILKKLSENWPDYFKGKEPIIHEYLTNVKNKIEDISQELKILYYNKTTKSIWDTFIDLQLQENKVEKENISVKDSEESETENISTDKLIIHFNDIVSKKHKPKEILEKGIDTIIYGEMGSGKTTIIKKIVLDLIRDFENNSKNSNSLDKIPVILYARNFNADLDLKTCVIDEIIKRSNNKILNIENLLNTGRFVLFIDGLDEINKDIQIYFEKIKQFKENFPSILLIVTSRPSTLIDQAFVFANFRRFEILPLSFQQIENLLEKWYPTSKTHKNKLLNVLKRTLLSNALPKTPLSITLLAIIFDENEKIEEIPANITELYNKFTEVFMGKWDKENGISNQDKYGIRNHLINHIAFYFHFNNKNDLSEDEFYLLINNYKNSKGYNDISNEDFISTLLNRNPLFVKLKNNNYKFIHLSFQEYFASKGIEQSNKFVTNTEDFLIKNFLDEWWSNVIIFYVGNKKDCPQFIIKISSIVCPIHNLDHFVKIDLLGKILQAAISTDNVEKKLGVNSALKSVDLFRYAIINEASNDKNINSFFRKLKLNELYIIHFLKIMFSNSFKSKHLKYPLLEIYNDLKLKNTSDLAYYSVSYTLTSITENPEYLLDFCNDTNIKLEWRFLGIKEVEKYLKGKLPISKEQRKKIKSVYRKIKKGHIYLVSEFKKLSKIPILKNKI